MCTKDRNVYIKFVRVSNNLYYYARYLLRLWCSRMWHGGMVSRGRWDMRWWWFSLTDILIHIIHVIHTYVHTLRWGGDTPAAPTLFRYYFFLVYIYIYVHIHTYAHIHTYVNIHIPATMHTHVRGRYPSCTVYILPRHCIPGWGWRYPGCTLCTFFWTLHTQVRGRYPSCTLTCISIHALRQGEWVGLLVIYLMRR